MESEGIQPPDKITLSYYRFSKGLQFINYAGKFNQFHNSGAGRTWNVWLMLLNVNVWQYKYSCCPAPQIVDCLSELLMHTEHADEILIITGISKISNRRLQIRIMITEFGGVNLRHDRINSC